MINIAGIQWFDVEYGIYFMRETGFFFFHESEAQVKILQSLVSRVK